MRVLRMGSLGPAVELLQLALNRAGFGELAEDGIFGPAVDAALRRFQKSAGISADGIAGQETHRAILPWYTGYLVYKIQRGDTVYSTACRFKSSEQAILLANPDIDPLNLRIGTSIVVPLPFPVVPTGIRFSSALTGYCVRGLAARYPFLSVGEIGKSVMGRPLWRISLGSGENRVLYNASHHANEWICTPLLLRFIEELSEAFASGGSLSDISAAELLDYASLNIIPAVNPDGMDLVTGELQTGDFFRQAQRIAADYPGFAFPSGWKANIRGTDLNLQYPAGWEQARKNKYSQGIVSPAPADYVGPMPLSAPESRAMYDYTLALFPALTLSYHTQGRVIYWKYLDREPPKAREAGRFFSELSGYTLEAGLGTNPLPLSQFEEIYRRNLGILVNAALVT